MQLMQFYGFYLMLLSVSFINISWQQQFENMAPWSKHLDANSECPTINKDKVTLFNMRYCPFAQRAALVLLAKDIPFDMVNVNLKSKPQWFLDRNPLGKVPTVQIGDDVTYERSVYHLNIDVISQLFLYYQKSYPKSFNLKPSSMWLFGRDLSWQTTKSANSFGKGSRQNGSRPLWQYHWLLLQAIEVIEISFSSNQNRLIHLSFQVWGRRKGNFAQIVPRIVEILGRRIE